MIVVKVHFWSIFTTITTIGTYHFHTFRYLSSVPLRTIVDHPPLVVPIGTSYDIPIDFPKISCCTNFSKRFHVDFWTFWPYLTPYISMYEGNQPFCCLHKYLLYYLYDIGHLRSHLVFGLSRWEHAQVGHRKCIGKYTHVIFSIFHHV